jgi:hypothetical protein
VKEQSSSFGRGSELGSRTFVVADREFQLVFMVVLGWVTSWEGLVFYSFLKPTPTLLVTNGYVVVCCCV